MKITYFIGTYSLIGDISQEMYFSSNNANFLMIASWNQIFIIINQTKNMVFDYSNYSSRFFNNE